MERADGLQAHFPLGFMEWVAKTTNNPDLLNFDPLV
jgi:hypothetical protein